MTTKINPITDAELTEMVNQYLSYDRDTGEFTWKVARGKAAKGSTAGTKDAHGYVIIRMKGFGYKAHRLAWLVEKGYLPKDPLVIDHKNGQKDDNRIDNLQAITGQANVQKKVTSKLYPGVSLLPSGNYRVRVAINKDNCRKRTNETFDNFWSAVLRARELHREYRPETYAVMPKVSEVFAKRNPAIR